MKHFLRYIFLIISSLLIVLYALDYIYTYIYINGIPRNKISYILSQKNIKIDYIFIGSSRVDNGIDPKIIEAITGKTAINLGIQGANIKDYFFLLKLLNKQNIKSEKIFIQIDNNFNSDGNSEITRSSLMPFIHEEEVSNFIKETDPFYLQLKYFPFYRYLKYDYKIGFREMINTLYGNKPRINLDDGYFPKYGYGGESMQVELSAEIIDKNYTIEDINHFCRDNNIQLYYFIAPLCQKTKNLIFVTKLNEKLPKFLNFSSALSDDKLFLDCIHLNDSGAKEFSRILAEEIIQSK